MEQWMQAQSLWVLSAVAGSCMGVMAWIIGGWLVEWAGKQVHARRERLEANRRAECCAHGVKRWKSCADCAVEFAMGVKAPEHKLKSPGPDDMIVGTYTPMRLALDKTKADAQIAEALETIEKFKKHGVYAVPGETVEMKVEFRPDTYEFNRSMEQFMASWGFKVDWIEWHSPDPLARSEIRLRGRFTHDREVVSRYKRGCWVRHESGRIGVILQRLDVMAKDTWLVQDTCGPGMWDSKNLSPWNESFFGPAYPRQGEVWRRFPCVRHNAEFPYQAACNNDWSFVATRDWVQSETQGYLDCGCLAPVNFGRG